ncbi:MAG: hypothetical protein RL329_3662 [Bacteroidota bacterium]
MSSKSAWYFSILFLFFASFYGYPKWSKPNTEATLSWDVSGYYYYLPAFFIYKDPKQLRFKEDIQQKYNPSSSLYQAFKEEKSGNYVMKYSAGQAVLYAPAFFLAHFVAKMFGFSADGFSLPYQFAIQLWSVLIAFLGLYYLRKTLLKLKFADTIVAMILILYVLGTNYLNYAAIDCAMSHNYLFTLYSLLLWETIHFYENAPSIGRGLRIGVIIGLAMLTRPTEIIAAIIPLLWNVFDYNSLKNRLLFIIENFKIIIITTLIGGIIGSIQLFYWKYITGSWLVYSYGNQTFSWLKPHLLDGLVSAKKGWLVYTPMMIFPLIGFYFLYRNRKSWFLATALFLFCFIWIAFAWDIWWYGGSLGQRQMVQSYPILAIPLAAFLEATIHKKSFKILAIPIAILGIYLNVWWHYQAHGGGLFDSEGMTRQFLWRVLGRYDVPIEAQKLLDNKYDFNMPANATLIYSNDFEKDTTQNIDKQNIINGKQSIFVDKDHQFMPDILIPFQSNGKDKIRATAIFRTMAKEWDVWKMAQFRMVFQKDGITLKDNSIRIQRVLNGGETKTIWLDAKIPTGTNRIIVKLWNADGNQKIVMDDLKITVFE